MKGKRLKLFVLKFLNKLTYKIKYNMEHIFYKTLLLITTILIMSSFAFSNEQATITISGPEKIFTKDRVTYKVIFNGDNNVRVIGYIWEKNDDVIDDDENCEITANSSPEIITLKCYTRIRIGDDAAFDRIIEKEKQITVVEPNITVIRDSYKESDFIGTGFQRRRENIGKTGKALLHLNGMDILEDRMYLSIVITPSDVGVQQFSISLSSNGTINAYQKRNSTYNFIPRVFDYNPSGTMALSNFQHFYTNCFIDGKHANNNCQLKISINNDEKVSLNYGVFGFEEGEDIIYPDSELKEKLAPGTHLIDNEWVVKKNSENDKYNCLSYALKQSGTINDVFFWVKDALGPNPQYVYDDKFIANPNYTNYFLTSIDTFGNNNGLFDNHDIDNFFTNSYWGNDRAIEATSNFDDCRIIYYNTTMFGPNFHAARKSLRTNGCHLDWHIFESKMGKYEIVIHRAEQIGGKLYGIIKKKYK